MKRAPIIFLQIVIVLIALVTLAAMIRFPLTEGRAANLDLFSIYADPLIVYGYLASIPFFLALYQAFTLLGYIGRNKVFSLSSVRALRIIKYCAISQSLLIILAAVYIWLYHAPDDDPAGFMALAIVATFMAIVVATAVAVLERLCQTVVAMAAAKD